MEKQFVTYEIALELKELGFNEHCIAFYYLFENEEKFLISTITNTNSSWGKDTHMSAPLWQQALEFLRQNHINIEIAYQAINLWRASAFCIFKKDTDVDFREIFFIDKETYEEAREQAILQAIELIKDNNEKAGNS